MSDFSYSELRKNIKKYRIPNVEKYFDDLENIEHSFSGRMDIPLVNIFIMESVQLIVNSISLFEMGYFDSAYYSLREAIEVSTIIVYFSDVPEDERKGKWEDWKNGEYFPMQGQMLKELLEYGNVVSDMEYKMSSFFNEVKDISKKINKRVHKQGFKNFYVSENYPLMLKKDDNIFIDNYVYYLEKTIGIVAVMRLAIDPYPILLMDEEISRRCFVSMTEAYKNEFVERYISKETLDNYKKTEIYIKHYNSHIKNEKMNDSVFYIMKNQLIDTTKKSEILSQINLLDPLDKIAIYVALATKKSLKIHYHYYKMRGYITRNDLFSGFTCKSDGLNEKYLKENSEKYNIEFEDYFRSVFKYRVENDEKILCIEHQEKLTEKIIDKIKKILLTREMSSVVVNIANVQYEAFKSRHK